MSFPQVIVILHPLRKAAKGDHFVALELVPHVHGKDLRLVRSVEHGRPGVQPSGVHPGNVRPLQLLLHSLQLLVDDHITKLLLQSRVGVLQLLFILMVKCKQVCFLRGTYKRYKKYIVHTRGVEGKRSFSSGVSVSPSGKNCRCGP